MTHLFIFLQYQYRKKSLWQQKNQNFTHMRNSRNQNQVFNNLVFVVVMHDRKVSIPVFLYNKNLRLCTKKCTSNLNSRLKLSFLVLAKNLSEQFKLISRLKDYHRFATKKSQNVLQNKFYFKIEVLLKFQRLWTLSMKFTVK